jgi:hypothetical protein
MSGVELATWFALGLFWLSRLALVVIVVLVVIAIVRVLRLPPYVSPPDEAEEDLVVPPGFAVPH